MIGEPYFSSNFDVFITRDSQNVLVCSFPNGISVTITISSGMLSFVLGIPDDFRNITRGLMGNYNGIEMDDLEYRNGTMLAQNSSDRLIHEMGQSCKCVLLVAKIDNWNSECETCMSVTLWSSCRSRSPSIKPKSP